MTPNRSTLLVGKQKQGSQVVAEVELEGTFPGSSESEADITKQSSARVIRVSLVFRAHVVGFFFKWHLKLLRVSPVIALFYSGCCFSLAFLPVFKFTSAASAQRAVYCVVNRQFFLFQNNCSYNFATRTTLAIPHIPIHPHHNYHSMSNTVSVSSLPLSLSNSDLWTTQSARHAVVAARLISGKAPGHGSSRRRAVRMRPSPLGRFSPWTLTSEAPIQTVSALATYQPSRTRTTLGLGHPSNSSKRSKPVESAAPACSEPVPPCCRASLGLGHPTTSARRHAAPVEPITIAPGKPTQQPRGRANIGLGHPSTSPRRPIAPAALQPSVVIPTPRKRSYAQTLVHETLNQITGRRVTPTRCADRQHGGVSVSLITALVLRSTSSGTARAGPSQVHSLDEAVTEKQEEKDSGGCEIVDEEDEFIQLAARIEVRARFAGRGMKLF
ncbi:hypothetical protein DFH06DRAFT_1301178 [Mycena polygramma]|nr:hypothetical protein DFH06DRAFT_1301178 [Mycena polygramma]